MAEDDDAIDVLYDELKNKKPHWLSLPERDPKRAEEIRQKHRNRYLKEKGKNKAKAFNEEDHPRDDQGRWTDAGGGDGGGDGDSGGDGDGREDHPGPGYSSSARVDSKGVIHTSSVYDATRALSEGRKVSLNQPKQLSTLIQHLGQVAKAMSSMGQKAPTFDLCNVSVKGTNLFCAESKGIERVKMPQLTKEQTRDFVKQLKSQGVKVKKDKEDAANLRATQNQINGVKVAANMEKIAGGKERRLIISKDDYVLDGHHYWAAAVGVDAQNNRLKDDKEMKVYRVDMKIIPLLEASLKFTGGAGAKPVDEKSEQIAERELYAWLDKEAEPMPLKPGKDESKDDFVSRCMSEVYGDDAPEDRTQEQALAICYGYWNDSKGIKTKQVCEVEPDESEDDFMERCIGEGHGEDTCQAIWDDYDDFAEDKGIVHKTHSEQVQGMEFVLSDETPDRMDDIIMSDGWDLTDFQKNPIALFNHNSDFIVGKWHNLRIDNKQLRGHLELAPKGASARIDEIRALIDADILRATSVGFKPIKRTMRDEKNPFSGCVFHQQTLLETSLVSVPANPNAVAIAKQLKISDDTMRMVFAKNGSDNIVRRRIVVNGKNAKGHSSNGRGASMSLAQRIHDSQTRLGELRTTLETLLEKMDDSNPSNEDLEKTQGLSAKIAQEEKTHTTLIEAEKRLGKSLQDGMSNGKGRALMVVQHQNDGVAAPAIIKQRSKDLNLFDYMVRGFTVGLKAKIDGKSIEQTRETYYGDDVETRGVVEVITRAASAPAMTTVTGWAAELVQQTYAELMPLLMPKAILTRLAPRGLTLQFGSSGKIIIPTRAATPTIAGSFVGEGLAIPVRQGAFTSQTLTPKKMAVISTWTREMGDHSIPSIEGLIREAIQQDTSVAVDSVLIDANAATVIRPAGLLNGVSKTTATSGGGIAALVGDITALINAISTATKGNTRNLVWLANQTDLLRASMLTATNTGIFPFREEIARGTLNNIPIIDSATITARMLILIDAADFVVVGGEAPRMEMSDQATLHMEDTTPLELVASPSTVAAPQRSLFQTDSLALRMVMPLNWTQRRTGTVAWTDTVTW